MLRERKGEGLRGYIAALKHRMRPLSVIQKLQLTFHIFLSLNSSTRASSGVMVAHCD